MHCFLKDNEIPPPVWRFFAAFEKMRISCGFATLYKKPPKVYSATIEDT
jgi:hypothetical protein